MPTPAHKCEKRAHHTICPSCGRVAPDWCAEDEPANTDIVDVVLTGSDLPPEEDPAPPEAPKRGKKAAEA